MLGALVRRRNLIIGTTTVVAILAVVISLLLPTWYRASTRLLPPSQGASGLLSAALGSLPSAAQSLLGGGGSDYLRYLSILSSRTVMGAVVEEFDLATVYDVADSDTPHEDALELLAENVEFVVDMEYDFLAIEVLDQDPERAAAMANFFAEELNRVNARLSSETARTLREHVEARYLEADMALDSVMTATQSFQEQYGVFDLPTQTQAFFEQIGAMRAEQLQAEIRYETLLDQLGEGNSQVGAARNAMRAAQRKYTEALSGAEQLLPIPQSDVPSVAHQYFELERERILQGRILETITPLLEQARFEERRTVEAVQVLDPAVPPVEKAKPTRSIICIVATLSAFLLSILLVLSHAWWKEHHRHLYERFSAATAPTAPVA